MKLKYLVAALGLVAAVGAQAQIVPATTPGGSDMMLTVWEQNAPSGAVDQSFTFNLNETLSQFVANEGSSSTLATLLSTDSTWQSFLASSDTTDVGALQWSVVATGQKTNSAVGSYGVLASVTNGYETAAAGQKNGTIAAANTTFASYLTNLTTTGASNVNEQVNVSPSNAYYQYSDDANLEGDAWLNGNNIGATAVVEQATLIKGGASQGVANINVLPGTLTFEQSGSSYVLSYDVAAVPEPSAVALFLSGLGVMGFVAIRRKNNA